MRSSLLKDGARLVAAFVTAFLHLRLSQSEGALSDLTGTFVDKFRCSRMHNVFKMLHRLCICEPCHACRYSFQSRACVLSDVLRQGTNDTVRLQPIQPVLDPVKWFLTEAEMRATRSGVPRNGLQLYSLGNNITTYSVTSDYFSAILNDSLSVSSPNDRVYFAGWKIADIVMDPRAVRFDETRLTEILRVVKAKGADIRALIWANTEMSAGREVQRVMNDVLPKPFDGSARFLYDDRVPSIVGSHHQKMFIVKRDHQLTAYIGGVDLFLDRWDTMTHNEQSLRDSAGVNAKYKGWVDAQVGIHGPAAKDVANNFIARWNAPGEPIQQLRNTELGVDNPPHTPLGGIEMDNTGKYADPLVYPQPGPSAVQIVRTFGCKHKGAYNSFAPKGEFSVHAAVKKAILMAQNFITSPAGHYRNPAHSDILARFWLRKASIRHDLTNASALSDKSTVV
uniref:phospholipase D n=1 Tax=Albugo laibachii Nc14 TaxID=890382 RepID=F0WQH5_9STRA|nr:CHXC6_RACE [Albugo laibachii Nc14]|eukprot:CCA23584.1 CHXC6_RACE [Albugo laibachii Nc14]